MIGKFLLQDIKIVHLTLTFFMFSLASQAQSEKSDTSVSDTNLLKGLKDYYQKYFPIGVAVSSKSISGEEGRLIKREFNSLTAENVMKMGTIHPQKETYYWKDADALMQFAKENNFKVRGHNLCWHQQTPHWIFKYANGDTVNKAELLARLRNHIKTVAGRYMGEIYAWDVVNEAIDDDDNNYLRATPWLKICGEDYISEAFKYAHEADPKAKLFYNDYGIEKPGKRRRTYQLLKKLLDAKVPIHGVGIQGHWSIHEDFSADLIAAIKLFSSLGLEVQITELDISIYGNNDRPPINATSIALTEEAANKQLQQYRKVFQIARDYKSVISGITFWNVTDKRSWLDNFPVKGRKDYPLLFDEHLQRKKAYWAVVIF